MSYIVIKCGGSVLEQLPTTFFENIVTLMTQYHLKPVIVHGGGPKISTTLSRFKIETNFVNGLRITTEPVLDVVEMVLSGSINKWLVRKITEQGGAAIGLSGVDGLLLKGKANKSHEDLGYVGEVESVNCTLIDTLLENHFIPVISPVAIDSNGQRWNINGDLAAAAISNALKAPLCLVSNIPGIMENNRVLHELSLSQVNTLIETGTITGGMIPKVQAAIECLYKGVEKVVILNGTEKDSLIKFTENHRIGTKLSLTGV